MKILSNYLLQNSSISELGESCFFRVAAGIKCTCGLFDQWFGGMDVETYDFVNLEQCERVCCSCGYCSVDLENNVPYVHSYYIFNGTREFCKKRFIIEK